MATPSPDHRKRSWNRVAAGSRAESSPPIDVRAAVQRKLGRMSAERSKMGPSFTEMMATWRMPSAVAAGVCAIAAVSIFVMQDAPSLLSDPFLFLLVNR